MNVLDFVQVYEGDMRALQGNLLKVPPSELTSHSWYNSATDNLREKKCTSLIYKPDSDSEMSIQMFHIVDSVLKQYFEKFPRAESINMSSPGRFNIYREGDSMDTHVDHIYDLFSPPTRGIPVLSIVGLLNDDFEGGEFTMCGEVLPLKANNIVVFPSVFAFPHSVGVVTKGTRYSFVSWAW